MRKIVGALLIVLMLSCAVALAEDMPFPTDAASFPYSADDFSWDLPVPDVTTETVNGELTVTVDWHDIDFYNAECYLSTPNGDTRSFLVFGDTNKTDVSRSNRINLNQSFRLTEPPEDFDADTPGNIVVLTLSLSDYYNTRIAVSYSVQTGEIVGKSRTSISLAENDSVLVSCTVDFDSLDQITYYQYSETARFNDGGGLERAFWYLYYDENGEAYPSSYSRLFYPDGVSVEYDYQGRIASEPIYLFDGSKVYQWNEASGAWLDGDKVVDGLTPFVAENYPEITFIGGHANDHYDPSTIVYANLSDLGLDAAQLLSEIPPFSATGLDPTEAEAFYNYESATGLSALASYQEGEFREAFLHGDDRFPFSVLIISGPSGLQEASFDMRPSDDWVSVCYNADGTLNNYVYIVDDLDIFYDAHNQLINDHDGTIDPSVYPPLQIVGVVTESVSAGSGESVIEAGDVVYANLELAGVDPALYAGMDEYTLSNEDVTFLASYDGNGMLVYYFYMVGDDDASYALVMYDANNTLLALEAPEGADPADYPPLEIIR